MFGFDLILYFNNERILEITTKLAVSVVVIKSKPTVFCTTLKVIKLV